MDSGSSCRFHRWTSGQHRGGLSAGPEQVQPPIRPACGSRGFRSITSSTTIPVRRRSCFALKAAATTRRIRLGAAILVIRTTTRFASRRAAAWPTSSPTDDSRSAWAAGPSSTSSIGSARRAHRGGAAARGHGDHPCALLRKTTSRTAARPQFGPATARAQAAAAAVSADMGRRRARGDHQVGGPARLQLLATPGASRSRGSSSCTEKSRRSWPRSSRPSAALRLVADDVRGRRRRRRPWTACVPSRRATASHQALPQPGAVKGGYTKVSRGR